jgi:hypothetical protein
MLNRREFSHAMTAVGAAIFGGNIAVADTIAPTAAAEATPKLTPTEQLMYSTVRLTYQTPTQINGNTVIQTKWGTAFLFAFFRTGQSSVPALVTNRHVVADMKQCTFALASIGSDGMPDINNHIPIVINEFDKAWIPHPSVDLAIIPIGNILSELKTKPFLVFLDQTLIPTDTELKDLTPVEQVLTVGFPGAIWDDVHNLPIFHRGYTASAPYIEFKGKKEFLIDFTTWPGASGSPVLLYNEGGWVDRRGNTMMGGIRTKLIGVVYGVAEQDVRGNVVIQNGPTSIAAAGQMSVPTNLSACITASRILEFEPLLISKGVTPPPGYKMRAN